jgi:hypothetical protein
MRKVRRDAGLRGKLRSQLTFVVAGIQAVPEVSGDLLGEIS